MWVWRLTTHNFGQGLVAGQLTSQRGRVRVGVVVEETERAEITDRAEAVTVGSDS